MYGLINRFVAHPGQRNALVAAMLPGCRSFVVAHDPKVPDAVWVTEVWDSKAAWKDSMEMEAVKMSIPMDIPLVRDWGETLETDVAASLGS